MHILGLSNGSIGGNSEIILKAALLSAKKSNPDITTSWIHVPSVAYPTNAQALRGAPDVSMGTVASNGGSTVDNTRHDAANDDVTNNTNANVNTNIITTNKQNSIEPEKGRSGRNDVEEKDDRSLLLHAILSADALLISTPVYSHQPRGTLKAVLDTILGPYTDVALARRIQAAKHQQEQVQIDTSHTQHSNQSDPSSATAKLSAMPLNPLLLKPRVAAFLAVGGSSTPDQFNQVLPSLHTYVYSLHARVIDQAIIPACANPGAVLLKPGALGRAEILGRRLASQIGKAYEDAEYLGERVRGACPQCHLYAIEMLHVQSGRVGCVACGNTGVLVAVVVIRASESGKKEEEEKKEEAEGRGAFEVRWDAGSEYCCLTMRGKEKHVDDIFEKGSAEWKGIRGDEGFEESLREWRGVECGKIEF